MPVPEAQQLLNDLEDLLRKSPELERQLPVRPEEPLPRDCCGQSCSPCIYDMYRVELDDWTRRCWRQLKQDGKEEAATDENNDDATPASPPLFTFQPNNYRSLKLYSITPISPDTNVYRFVLPSPKQLLFLPVGTHVIMKGFYEPKLGEREQRNTSESEKPIKQLISVVRQYTPITIPDATGYMDLMIKLYPHGKMSSYLRRLQTPIENGEEVLVEFRGPYGLFTYSSNQYADLLMLAAGTGLAPMAQVIEHILENEDDMTRIRLLLCCRQYEDILLKERMKEWRRRWNFSVRYVLSQWREGPDRRLSMYGDDIIGGTRLNSDHVDEEVQRLQRLEHARNGSSQSAPISPAFQVLICGTKSFEKDAMNYLLKAGVVAKRIFRF